MVSLLCLDAANLVPRPAQFLLPVSLAASIFNPSCTLRAPPPPPPRDSLVSRAISLCPEFDRHELLIYEEVARMPPFRRKTLVLIGAQGVGRRSLKNKLILWDPDRYGTTVPCEWGPCSGRRVGTGRGKREGGAVVEGC